MITDFNPIETPEKTVSSASERQSSNWDIRNAPRNYLSLVLSQFGIACFSFISVWLATRFLGVDGYGKVAALLVASQFSQIAVMWTCTGMARYGVQEFVETGRITETFWARTAIFIPNLILVVALSPFWLPPLAAWLKLPPESFPFVVLLICAVAFAMHVQFALQAAKLPRLQGWLLMLERVVTFSTLVFLIAAGRLTWLTAIWAYTIPSFVSAAIGLWKLRSFIAGKIVISRSRVKEILAFSLPLPLYSLLGHFSFNHLDAIFILRYLTIADLGVYSVAYQINGLILQLPTLAGSLLLPLFVTVQASRADNQMQTAYFRDIVPFLTLGLGLFCACVAAAGFYLLPLIFGRQFAQVGSLLWIFAAATVVSVPAATGFLPLSNATSTTYVQMLAAFAAAVVNIALNILLIPRFGLIGCAWATVAAFAASMLVFASLLGRKFSLPYLTAVLATLPSVAGAACFSLSGNVIFSFLAVLGCAAFLFAARRETFSNGWRKLIGFRNRGKV